MRSKAESDQKLFKDQIGALKEQVAKATGQHKENLKKKLAKNEKEQRARIRMLEELKRKEVEAIRQNAQLELQTQRFAALASESTIKNEIQRLEFEYQQALQSGNVKAQKRIQFSLMQLETDLLQGKHDLLQGKNQRQEAEIKRQAELIDSLKK